MSVVKNTPKISEDYVVKVRGAMQHRAQWLYLILDEAKKSGADWESIARLATTRCGCFQGLDLSNAWNNHNDLVAFTEVFADEDFKKYFEMEIIESTEKNLKVNFHHCPLVAGWQAIGCSDLEISKLCDIAMDGDRSIAKTCGLAFKLGSTIANGDDVCHLSFSIGG